MDLSYQEQGFVLFRAVEGGGFDDLMVEDAHANRIRARIRSFGCDPSLWCGIVGPGTYARRCFDYDAECAADDFGRAWRKRQSQIEDDGEPFDASLNVSLAWPR